MNKFARALFRPALILLAGSFLVLSAGCSSEQGRLRMVSIDNQRNFSQTFSRAYISQNSTGDSDIVLIQDDSDARNDDPRKPITPDSRVYPRQLVHIRVFWVPQPGIKADHPANTNASIHWCMLGDNPEQSDVLEYSGSGLVEVDRSGPDATINIRTAWMKATTQHGNLTDPLGPSRANGKVHAIADDAQVQLVLAEIKSANGPVAAIVLPVQPQRLSVNP